MADRLQRAAARLRDRSARDADGRRRSSCTSSARWATCSRSTCGTGDVLWQKDYVTDFNAAIPSWGMSGAPLVDGDRLICLVGGEPDAKLVALDKRTGKEVWRALSSDSEAGLQPAGHHRGGRRAAAHRVPRRRLLPRSTRRQARCTGRWNIAVQMGIVVATPVQSGPHLFFTSQYGGARMLQARRGQAGGHAPMGRPGRTGSRIQPRHAEYA